MALAILIFSEGFEDNKEEINRDSVAQNDDAQTMKVIKKYTRFNWISQVSKI